MSNKVNFGLSLKFQPTEKSMSKLSGDLGFDTEFEKKTIIRKLSEISNVKVNANDAN